MDYLNNWRNKFSENLLVIDINKTLTQDIWSIKNQNNRNNNFEDSIKAIKKLVSSLYNSLFFEPKIEKSKKNNNLIFYIRTHKRPDVDAHSKCYENVDKTTVCIFANKIKNIKIINFLFSFYFMWFLRKIFFKICKENQINLLSPNGIKLFTTLYESVSNSQKIFEILLQHSKVVSFQEMIPTENMICQIANLNNIETFALEQGIGFYKLNGEYWEKYPITTYLNSVCKNILCWGEFSKEIYDQHTNANKFIIGKPSLPNVDKIEKGLTFVFQNKDCVSANEKLMKISDLFEKNDVQVSRWYKKKGNIIIKNSVGRDGPLREIVVGSSSNLLVELGFLGLKVLVIKGSILEKSLPKELVLDEGNGQKEILKKYIANYPHEIWKKFISFSSEKSVNKYKSILL